MLAYSVLTMAASPLVDRLVLVARDQDTESIGEVAAGLDKPVSIVTGGPSRTASEQKALNHLAPHVEAGSVDIIAIHDGARPFLTHALLERVVVAATEHGGAIPGLSITEPLYRSKGGTAQHLAQDTLRRVQTPQAFQATRLLAAYRLAATAGVEAVDTAEIVERFSDMEVALVPGDPRNIKVTFVEDFFVAEEYAQMWQGGRWLDQ